MEAQIGGKTRSAGSSLVLATDLDGTFAGGSPEDRARLQDVLRALPNATLIYVTGRSVPATRSLAAEIGLPTPDYLIADVGTTIVRGADFAPVRDLEAGIERRWPGSDVVRARLADEASLAEQSVGAERRVSYELVRGTLDAAVRRAADRLGDVAVDLLGSHGVYLDVLPSGVNKGSTLLRLLDWLGREHADVVVAGDTLNDLALFETGLAGILVANCEPALRERVAHLRHLYCARAEGAAGILEGLRHFAWTEADDHGE